MRTLAWLRSKRLLVAAPAPEDCSRPPLSLERLSVLPDGRVAYAIRKPWGRQTHRVMTPVEFLARLCAVIPPPRHPLLRFHGVFAPLGVASSRGAGDPNGRPRAGSR